MTFLVRWVLFQWQCVAFRKWRLKLSALASTGTGLRGARGESLAAVGDAFGVSGEAVRQALLLTERQYERRKETRGRPPALSRDQVPREFWSA